MNNNIQKEIASLRCNNNVINEKIELILNELNQLNNLLKLNSNEEQIEEVKKYIQNQYKEYKIFFDPTINKIWYFEELNIFWIKIITKTMYNFNEWKEYLYFNFV